MVNPDSSLSHSNLGSNIEQYQVERVPDGPK